MRKMIIGSGENESESEKCVREKKKHLQTRAIFELSSRQVVTPIFWIFWCELNSTLNHCFVFHLPFLPAALYN